MNPRLRRSFSLPSLLLLLAALSACSEESGVPADAAVDATPIDTPSTDVPSMDVPSVDVPSVDVPSVDVPSVDVPSVDVSQPSDACARPDIARLPERIDCGPRGGTTCPTGYSCLSFSGVVLQQFCGISCRSDCDCPSGERCGTYSDKAGTHPLCVAATMNAR
ncbi:MAG: hypothetical protein IPN17_24750 [Deltaproteobacteria bacterium]|nr:hypothetical protein [Deltaproteobacteria bacterium]